MNAINWQQFGLRKNPYDTMPLIEGGDLPIEQAFVGRNNERNIIDSLFESNERLCLTVCGDVGVGKTSLINFQKFIWKYKKVKLLFSFRREIEASYELLNKKSFLIEIMGSVIREIRLLQPELLNNELLKNISQIVDISQTIALSGGGTIFGFGLELGGEKKINYPLQLSISVLEEYFHNLIAFIKNNKIKGLKYSGLIVHVNNFDVVLRDANRKELVINFFDEIRDILQTQNVYFIFLGPKNFFKEIINVNQRVKSIFYQTSLQINPLSKTEILDAFKERMILLQSDDVISYIKPVEDDVIYKIYDLYDGDVRSIMASIVDIMGQYSEMLAKSLTVDEAMFLLGRERWDKIENAIKLTSEQKQILKYLAGKDLISQKEIVQLFNKKQSNVSSYYFKPLRDNNIIEEKQKIDKTPYYGLTKDYMPLKWLVSTENNIQKNIKNKSQQLGLDLK